MHLKILICARALAENCLVEDWKCEENLMNGLQNFDLRMRIRVEWFSFFATLENGHFALDWLYFYEFNSRKWANFDARARYVAKSQGP